MVHQAPTVSIVLVVRDAAALMLRCLTALARLPETIDFEVVLVDDGSTDDTARILANVEGDLHALRNDAPVGFGPACDQGVAAAGAERLVLLGPEVVPVDGWLAPLLATLDGDKATGAVRPRGADLDGRLVAGPLWPCLAVRRAAYERAGGFAAVSRAGRADKASLLASIEDDGWVVVDEPASVVLVVPDLPSAT
jgi:glycosyltransferase involved in cell wall biosynthesis